MMVSAIDERDGNRRAGQRTRRGKPGETATDNEDVWN